MDDPLIGEVVSRLGADSKVSGRVEDLVLSALLGELDAVIGGASVDRPEVEAGDSAPPVRAYLDEVEVCGFRGIGPKTTLELRPGPGLTLVVGRNGSGKSSLSEAIELALTGDTKRWEGKSAEWTSGWRNLHADSDPEITVGLRVDGESAPRTIRMRWADGKLTSAETSVVVPGGPSGGREELGWTEAVEQFRPFLAYSELSSLIDGRPIDRYNALAPMLGMEALVEPREALRQARLAAEKQEDAGRGAVAAMLSEVSDIDDDRARAVADALTGSWDLAAVERIATGTAPESAELQRRLTQLEQLPAPDAGRAANAAAALRSAKTELEGLKGTDADRAALVADLLRKATAVHEHVGDGECPVCGSGELSQDRVHLLRTEIEKLDQRSSAVRRAQKSIRDAETAVVDAIGGVPSVLGETDGSDLGVDLREVKDAWASWIDVPADADGKAEHLEQKASMVVAATEAVREAAAKRQTELEDLWRPVASKVVEFLPQALEGKVATERVAPLRKAEKWLKDCEATIRGERFASVETRVKEVWSTIAVGSNVTLDGVKLGNKKVDLGVSVDGDESAALGVMSQGELFALALSLFIPRASFDESPFGFAVIDDPVQAMDPVRVDGLARVLNELAATRQVVVFTHDDRLPSAMRRLQIDARVIEVTRRPKSKVELRVAMDPIAAAIDDARAVFLTGGLPAEVARRVVPGLCRQAIEAACVDVGWRALLHIGTPHADCEAILADNPKLIPRISIALFADAARTNDVYSRLNNKFGRWAGDIVKKCNEMAHTGADEGEDLRDLINQAEKLAEALVA